MVPEGRARRSSSCCSTRRLGQLMTSMLMIRGSLFAYNSVNINSQMSVSQNETYLGPKPHHASPLLLLARLTLLLHLSLHRQMLCYLLVTQLTNPGINGRENRDDITCSRGRRGSDCTGECQCERQHKILPFIGG